jgi:hypothetical protein
MITVDLRPQKEAIILKYSPRKKITVPLLPSGKLAELKEKALKVKPVSYTKNMYAEHIEIARNTAEKNSNFDKNSVKQAVAKENKNLQNSSAALAT